MIIAGNLMLAKLSFVDFDQLEIEFPDFKDESNFTKNLLK